MLQKLAVILLGLAAFVTPVAAQDNIKMTIITECNSISNLRAYLKKEHGEIAFSSAPGIFKRVDEQYARGIFRTYINPKTYTFTSTVEFVEDDVACIISMGDDFAPVIHEGNTY